MGFIQWTEWSENFDSGMTGDDRYTVGRSAVGGEVYLPVLF